MASPSEASRGMERHIQTGIQLLIVGLLGWTLLTVHNMDVSMGRLEEKLIAQAGTIILLSKLSDDRYRAKDAERDFHVRDKAILAIDSRLLRVEKKIYGGE